MTEGGKDAIKKRGDHNGDMERMQFQKQQGNVSVEKDYVNLKMKVGSVQEAVEINSGNKPTSNSDKIHMGYIKGQNSIEKEKDS